MEQEKKSEQEITKQKKRLAKKNSYSDYSEFLGIVFQMFVIITAFVLVGRFLDSKLITEEGASPWFTVILSLSGCMLAMFLLIKKGNK